MGDAYFSVPDVIILLEERRPGSVSRELVEDLRNGMALRGPSPQIDVDRFEESLGLKWSNWEESWYEDDRAD